MDNQIEGTGRKHDSERGGQRDTPGEGETRRKNVEVQCTHLHASPRSCVCRTRPVGERILAPPRKERTEPWWRKPRVEKNENYSHLPNWMDAFSHPSSLGTPIDDERGNGYR